MTTQPKSDIHRRISTSVLAALAVVFAVGVLASCSDDENDNLPSDSTFSTFDTGVPSTLGSSTTDFGSDTSVDDTGLNSSTTNA